MPWETRCEPVTRLAINPQYRTLQVSGRAHPKTPLAFECSATHKIELMRDQNESLAMSSRTEKDMATSLEDYKNIKSVISYVSQEWQSQPSLQDIADHIGLAPTQCHKLFRRWSGLTPKEFLQAVTIDHAKTMLRQSASLLETAMETGLSGTSRLHDLFVDHESMTPGDYKRGGEGLTIFVGYHPSPFGHAVAMATDRGLCGLAFADDEATLASVRTDLAARWPGADYVDAPEKTSPYVTQIFMPAEWTKSSPVKIVLIGTDFEVRVWKKLLNVPMGHATSYSKIADHIGNPKASRAIGNAVGRNPLAFVVPCHRVLRKDGNLGGYHWGITRKRAIIGWEAGHLQGLLKDT